MRRNTGAGTSGSANVTAPSLSATTVEVGPILTHADAAAASTHQTSTRSALETLRRLPKWMQDETRLSEAHRRWTKKLYTRRPAWYDHKRVLAIYTEARRQRRTGRAVVVDHIVPLNGEGVCGLHVHTNLAIILARDNREKGHLFWPGGPWQTVLFDRPQQLELL